MVRIRTFRDLIAWQKGMKLALAVYRETVRTRREIAIKLTMLEPNPSVTELIAEEDRVLQGLINSIRQREKR